MATPPRRGPSYESLAREATLPDSDARSLVQCKAGCAAPLRRSTAPRLLGAAAALAALLAGSAAIAAWLGGRRARSSGSLRGGAQLEVEHFCSALDEDTEYHTQVPHFWKDGVLSAEMCCAECDGDPECGAWTWGKMTGVEGLSQRCFLKKLGQGEKPKRFSRKGVVSGLPARVLRKHGIVAGMLAKGPLQVANLSDATCPGDLAVGGLGKFRVVSARWHAPGSPAAHVGVAKEAWEASPRLASRAYLASNCTAGEYRRDEYAGFKLLNRTLRYSVDLSGAGCGCNAQLHLAAMRSNKNKSACSDYSCGAASSCGATCTELALQDANQYAWSSTFGAVRPGVGYGGGGAALARGRRDWNGSQYGPGALCVDTEWPFEVAVSFPVDADGVLRAVELRLTQESRPCSLSAQLGEASLGGRAGLRELSSALASGLTPVIGYEGSAKLDWLDGVDGEGSGPCVQDSPEACPAFVRFFDFAVSDGAESLLGDEPGKEPNLLERAGDAIHEHMVHEASQRRKKDLARLVGMSLVDGASEPCDEDCDKALGVRGNDIGASADEDYEEATTGNSEWEVVVNEVRVRSRPRADAEGLELRGRHDILIGKRRGGWIRLRRQPGFAPILDDDGKTALLKERIVRYQKIVSGSCSDHGLHAIEDPRACEVAAFMLGYFDLEASSADGPEERPEGCFLDNGRLYLSSNSSNRGNGVSGARFSLCSTGAYPITTTTTTTTVTTITTTTWGVPSLYCFEVMMRHTYEYPLVREQIQRKASIFSCDEYDVYSQDGPFSMGRGPDGPEVKAIWFKKAPVWKSEDNTAANALLFMNVFKAIKREGRYKNHHWTIKADPDAVLLPWRLRNHLRPVTNRNNFLVNCNKMPWHPPFPMIFGALEAYSNMSLHLFFTGGLERCVNQLNWRAWGEDKFMGFCLPMLGAQPHYDFSILADNRCTGAYCGNPTAAAFHDFKNQQAWFQCWEQATRVG